MEQEGIFRSALRSLVKGIFGSIGLAFGLCLALGIVFSFAGALITSVTTKQELPKFTTQRILPDATGIREIQGKDVPVILQVRIDGVIGQGNLKAASIEQQLTESREGDYKDNRVKGIFLHINSPGGVITEIDGIYKAILAYKKEHKVPVIAFVDGHCLSGGMYIASVADQIVATDSSLVGNIGAISPPFMNFSKLIQNLGIEAKTIYSGEGKDNMSPLRPWKEGESNDIQLVMDFYYNYFVDIVCNSRHKLTPSILKNEIGARYYPAPIAMEKGMVDAVGYDRNRALGELVKVAGIEGQKYQVVELEKKPWMLEILENQASSSAGKVQHELKIPGMLSPELQGHFLYLQQFE